MSDETPLPPDKIHLLQLQLEEIEHHPERHVTTEAVMEIRKAAMKCGKRHYGQLNVEDPDNQAGLNFLFSCFPSGDSFHWFICNGYFCLVLLVNEKIKTVAIVPCTEQEEFILILNQATNNLNIKNGYPVENPDDFTPVPTGRNENPPDKDNE